MPLLALLLLLILDAAGCGRGSTPSTGQDAGTIHSFGPRDGGLDAALDRTDGSNVLGPLLDARNQEDARIEDAASANLPDAADAAGLACGPTTCVEHQLCLVMMNGGPPHCAPTDDAGACPPPLTLRPSCPNLANGAGCVASGEPTPVACIDPAPSCANTPTCACLPSNVCALAYGECFRVLDRRVLCASAAP